ncbi:TRC40/GET3/ArsA family transport-energizing ATPase [Halorussus salilacus]|uniref:ArsA family ATPase n=1 Tax=Halorussus salilacus TaxID=2953750 RepID=UPI0020A04E97|nr:TRC40/GET3/ArsA family transport-energizing ATPase [Halorussus salilacus]USZ66838.1 TRC40/GET3/ArsA family transport-energizing ATPase [Halorussus salilacus]
MEKFVFFGGKGGVGKTTVSCAYGLKCAEAGLKTLVVSTDPAHSTSDVFDQQFGDDPEAVAGRENLWAMEIDPEEEVERHMMDIKRTMTDQVSPGIVNEIDRQIELAHRTPGAYEAALFDRFIDVMGESEEFDRVVFDTAPTGGTLRLLGLPDFLQDWIERLVEKRSKSIDLFERAAIGDREARKTAREDPIIARLTERKELFEFAGDTLRNDASFFLVLNPDELSIRETSRAIEDLTEYDLGVEGLVVNKVAPEPDADEDGTGARYLRERYENERDRIERIRTTFEPPVVARIEQRVEEVKGDLLAEVAAELDIDVATVPA